MKWTSAAREMRQETIEELIRQDPSRSLRRLKAFLKLRHGIDVTAATIHNDLKSLGFVRVWARIEGWSAERDGELTTVNSNKVRDGWG